MTIHWWAFHLVAGVRTIGDRIAKELPVNAGSTSAFELKRMIVALARRFIREISTVVLPVTLLGSEDAPIIGAMDEARRTRPDCTELFQLV